MHNLYISIFVILLVITIIVAFVFYFKKPYTKESFSNNNENNLLDNTSFSNGKHIQQHTDDVGKYDIIVFPNSGLSSYVLRQSRNKKISESSSIYYRMEIELKPNTTYYFGCLYFSTTNIPLINKVSFNNNETIYLKTKIDTYKTPEKSDFQCLYSLFKTPAENKNILTTIDFSFNFNNIKGFNYITDVNLSPVLDNNNIPITEDLRCYFNAYNPDSIEKNRKIIKDISDNGFDFISSNPSNIELGDFQLTNNTLKGPNAFQLQNANMLKLNPSFSAFILVRGNKLTQLETFTAEAEAEEEEYYIAPPDNNNILLIPGNQNSAVSLLLPQDYGYIYLKVGEHTFKTDIKTQTYLDNMLALTYNGNAISLFLNEEQILNVECPKIYFDNRPLQINSSGNFSGRFYAFAYYNSYLQEDKVRKISKYFLKMKANGGDITLFNKKINKDVSSFIIQPPKLHIHVKIEKTEECNCPKAIFEDGHYYVIIPNGSKLAETVGYSGIRDYGTDINTAKQIFEINFPKCPLPDILDKRKYKGDLTNCPFVMLVPENPCNQFECKNAQWDKGTVKNKNCKRSIDVYCSKYSEVDPACYCWKKENRDKPDCLKWRGKFEAEDKCDFRKHDIKNHPDYNKYIQKDKIPCWGCNLSAPESTSNNYACRPGSGAR